MHKRMFAKMLAVILVMSILASCGASSNENEAQSTSENTSEISNSEAESHVSVSDSESQDTENSASLPASTEATDNTAKSDFNLDTNQLVECCGIEFSIPAYYNCHEVLDDGYDLYRPFKPNDYVGIMLGKAGDLDNTKDFTQDNLGEYLQENLYEYVLDNFDTATDIELTDVDIFGQAGCVATFRQYEADNGKSTVRLTFIYNHNNHALVMAVLLHYDKEKLKHDYEGDFIKVIESAKLVDSNVGSANIRPEFQEAMASYEKFFDEYVEFMQNYSSSENAVNMFSDYLRFMSQYTETMEALEDIDEDDLSDEELTLYTQTMTRITQKLASVIQ